ncbi:MAG: hypothetical protein R3F59_15790 [Myxococcota bacterium]
MNRMTFTNRTNTSASTQPIGVMSGRRPRRRLGELVLEGALQVGDEVGAAGYRSSGAWARGQLGDGVDVLRQLRALDRGQLEAGRGRAHQHQSTTPAEYTSERALGTGSRSELGRQVPRLATRELVLGQVGGGDELPQRAADDLRLRHEGSLARPRVADADEDVLRTERPQDHAALVQRVEPFEQLDADLRRLLELERLAVDPVLLHELPERAAVEVLERDVRHTIVLPELPHPDEVRVRGLAGDAEQLQDPLALLAAGDVRPQQQQPDVLARAQLLGPVGAAERALVEEIDDLVLLGDQLPAGVLELGRHRAPLSWAPRAARPAGPTLP